MVTATFIQQHHPGAGVEGPRRPQTNHIGLVPVGVGVGTTGAVDFGIFNFWPTMILSVVRLFSERNARTVVWKRVAIVVRLSPDFTV